MPTIYDPLFSQQWYLHNPNGVNVVNVWDDYTGKGVLVGVIDDGFDYLHPDLNDNYRQDLDYDYNGDEYIDYNGNLIPDSNPFGNSQNSHGTNVAGIIAAQRGGGDSIGVAYGAEITGYRAIATSLPEVITATTNSINHAVNKDVDVINNSWGFSPQGPVYNGFYDDFNNSAFSNAKDAIENAVKNGRNNLGTAIVFAAGNHYAVGENTNYHNYQNSRHVITVGALNADGNVSSYSTPGASILVSGFGSEGNVVTTDRQGSAGENKSSGADGNYHYGFNGTSAAAPMVSGIIALMLEANPDLGYRDIQEILAYSARQTSLNTTYDLNGANNWNGGGLYVSHDTGFGLVDAYAAVRLAETWQSESTNHNEKSESKSQTVRQWIPDGYSQLSSTINMPSGIDIDFVEVDLNIPHDWRGDLEVFLTSPDGTTSQLIDNPMNGADDQNNIQFKTSSTHHWGETSGGNWTLTVKDLVSRNTWNTGWLNDWTLSLYGDTDTNDDTYIYTNEFSDVYSNSRQTLSDGNGGTDTINASAITSNTTLNLNSSQNSTLVGKSLGISSGTVIENAFTGDGQDKITGNSASNKLNGGRGNDTIDGGAGGIDTLIGGVGDDLYIVSSAATYYPTIEELDDEGTDTVQSYYNYTLGDHLENLNLTGTLNTTGTGNELNNTITGNSGNNSLTGGLGDDTLTGYDGGTEYDTLTGGLGDDTFVLGETLDLFYEGDGYGRVTDFNQFYDKIQLNGSSDDYSLQVASFSGFGSSAQDTAIRYGSDYIGVIQDVSNLSLTASYFDYV